MQGSETPPCATGYISYVLCDSLLHSELLQHKEILSRNLWQGNVWERRRELNPNPRALCSAHTLLPAAHCGLETCPEPPPEDKPGCAEDPDRLQGSDGHFCLSESRVMDLAGSHGSRSKHQAGWAAAKQ